MTKKQVPDEVIIGSKTKLKKEKANGRIEEDIERPKSSSSSRHHRVDAGEVADEEEDDEMTDYIDSNNEPAYVRSSHQRAKSNLPYVSSSSNRNIAVNGGRAEYSHSANASIRAGYMPNAYFLANNPSARIDNMIKINLDNIEDANFVNDMSSRYEEIPFGLESAVMTDASREDLTRRRSPIYASATETTARSKHKSIRISKKSIFDDDIGRNLEKMLIKMQKSFDPFKLHDEELKFAILKEILECQRLLLTANLKKDERKEKLISINEIYDEWKILAMIVDRICFFIYLAALILSSGIFFLREQVYNSVDPY